MRFIYTKKGVRFLFMQSEKVKSINVTIKTHHVNDLLPIGKASAQRKKKLHTYVQHERGEMT